MKGIGRAERFLDALEKGPAAAATTAVVDVPIVGT